MEENQGSWRKEGFVTTGSYTHGFLTMNSTILPPPCFGVLLHLRAPRKATCPTPLVSCCCLKAREAGITLEPGHKRSPLSHAAEEEGGSTALNAQSISPGFCFGLQNEQDSWHYAQLQLPEPFPSTWVQEQEGHNIRERGEAAS